MKQLIWLSIVSGYRSNSFKLLIILCLGCIGLAWLSASFSARSPDTIMLDVGLSLLRIVLTLMGVFWVQELYYKDIERKAVIFLLAYPISRGQYLLARFTGVSLLVSCSVAFSALLLLLVMISGDAEYAQAWPVNLGGPYLATWLFFWLDIMLVVAFAFLLCSVSETPNLPTVCALGFSVAMHAMGPILDFLRFSAAADQSQKLLIQPLIEFFLAVLPDLDRLDIRPWTLYNEMPPADLMGLGAIMAIAYTLLFLSLSVICLNRREIN